MNKESGLALLIIVVIIGGSIAIQKFWEKGGEKEVHVRGRVYFDTPPANLSDEYSDEEGTVDNIGVYKYTTGEFRYMYNYEKIETIELERFTGSGVGEATAYFEENIPYVENLCIGFLSGAPHPNDGHTRVEIDDNTENIELHYWNYIGPLPM